MSVSHLPTPLRLPRSQRWLNGWLPSRTLHFDPLQNVTVDGRYVPIPIAGWKFTPYVTRRLLELRIFRPLTFSSHERLAVIIPIRDREDHLQCLLPRLRRKLQEQALQHSIFVVEQEPGKLFNKGALINAGVSLAAAGHDYYCIHDVDAIPVDANYACPSQPVRLVTRLLGSQRGSLRPPRYFGGAITVRREQLHAANGFSNEYWGWGKEDDDFLFRLLFCGYLCYSDLQGTFEDLPNPSGQQVRSSGLLRAMSVRRNRRRRSLLMRGLLDPAADGLNTARRVVQQHSEKTHQRIVVRV